MAVQGKLLYIKVGEKEIECQTDLTLNMTANTTDTDACKPLSTDVGGTADWITRTVASREWDASVSAQTLVNAITTYNNIGDLMGIFVNGSLNVEVAIQTNSANTDYDQTSTFLFTGSAIMNGLTLNGPQDGVSTGDVTFVSNGKPTYTETVVPVGP